MRDHGVTITKPAAERIAALLSDVPAAPDTAGLRIDVVAGGCSGYQYRLALDDEREGDHVFVEGPVRLLVAGDALDFVRGAEVAFADTGFQIDNPNVVYGCGCGSSFQLRDDS